MYILENSYKYLNVSLNSILIEFFTSNSHIWLTPAITRRITFEIELFTSKNKVCFGKNGFFGCKITLYKC